MKQLNEAWTIPACWYYDHKIFIQEKEIFKRSWVYVADKTKLKHHGDNAPCQIIDEPILLTRNDNRIMALSNSCLHRGTLLKTNHDNCSKIVCPYHGWTYDINGKLLGCTEFEGVKNFDKDKESLKAFASEICGQFIFVNVNCKVHSLKDVLHHYLPNNIEDYIGFDSKTYNINCNWKVYVDNYLDGGYHVNHCHKELAEAIDYSEYNIEVDMPVVVQTTPLHDSEIRKGKAYYIWVFPNFMINIYDGVMDTNLVVPINENHCRVVFNHYFTDDFPANKRYASLALTDRIQREDISICERVQQGMKSSGYVNGRYSVKREAGVYHFHEHFRSFMS